MTVFTRTWNAAYELVPADSDNASEGAQRIRNTKEDVQERGVVDHSWAGDADDGGHKKITFVNPLAAKPTAAADEGYLYTKDVSAKAELFYEDEDGNEVQLTAVGSINAFPSGTRMLFHQTAAPTGWTKDTTINNQSLRVVSGTVSSGGATDFSSVFGTSKLTGSHVLTVAELAAHVHQQDDHPTSTIAEGGGAGSIITQSNAKVGTLDTGSTGSGSGHTHTLSLDLKFQDVILASKD